MEQYTVTGMSCAACSARVEKAVSRLNGVTSCSVSLLTNSMGVEGDVSAAEIIEAVEAAGYGASPKSREDAGSRSLGAAMDEDACFKTETYILPGVSHCAYVYFHGAYDVELAGAFSGRKPCGHGAGTVIADNGSHDCQPEVFCQRIPESVAPCPQYGYPGYVPDA